MRVLSIFALGFFVLMTALGVAQTSRQPGLFGGPGRDKGEDDNTRSVQGVVRGPNDALVRGAVVQLKDMKTLRVRSYITRDGGAYQFHGLSTEVDYELRATYKDLASEVKRLSVFDSRKKAVINLKLESNSS